MESNTSYWLHDQKVRENMAKYMEYDMIWIYCYRRIGEANMHLYPVYKVFLCALVLLCSSLAPAYLRIYEILFINVRILFSMYIVHSKVTIVNTQ